MLIVKTHLLTVTKENCFSLQGREVQQILIWYKVNTIKAIAIWYKYSSTWFTPLFLGSCRVGLKRRTKVTYEARVLSCSAVLNNLKGLKRAKRSGIQAQMTLISVPVTTLERKLLKSTVSTGSLLETYVKTGFILVGIEYSILLSLCILILYYIQIYHSSVLTHLFWSMLTPFSMSDSLLAVNSRLRSLLVGTEILKALSRSFSAVQ